ncbi:hypothetical protein [Flavobacterium sp. KACC 22761]|uniref:hypothetical protein n=1 Tax=Flavobacterium sp. KACC 22761 TaxID=3092665 RepID=UPI002A75B475|nr:hypothetical protein [Flavobacterium sp. KACC 22761]WPO80485.1 hypothetical protein SCB73_08865 [Flavobacterium sp. KACC 22761]
MKQLRIVFFCMIFISCANRKNAVSKIENRYNCKAISVTSEEVQHQYLSFIGDCDFCKKEFENFDKIKKGALLYHWQEGIGSNQFLIVDFDNDFSFFIKSEGFVKKKDFFLEDKKKLSFILEVLEKGNYYQSCDRFGGHSNLYVLLVKCDDEIKVQYFSPFTDFYEIKTSDKNVSSIKEVFEIMQRNYYCKS